MTKKEELQFEEKFLVFNRKDIDRYLTEKLKENLFVITKAIEFGRGSEGKQINNYYICNQDEPYAETVLKIILSNGSWIENEIRQAKIESKNKDFALFAGMYAVLQTQLSCIWNKISGKEEADEQVRKLIPQIEKLNKELENRISELEENK